MYRIKELQKEEVIIELTNKGVYCIENRKTGEKYIGSTTRSFRTR